MKKLLAFGTVIAMLLLSFVACNEGDDCDTYYGDITIYNFNNYPYNLYVDDSLVRKLMVLDTINLVLRPQKYIFKMEQAEGYDSVPWVFQDTLFIDPCTSIAWDPYDRIH